MKRIALLAAAVLSGACAPALTLVTPAPPNRVVNVNRHYDTIELSEGIAVAIDCDRLGSPCTDLRAVSAAPDVAGVYPAHIAAISHNYTEQRGVSTLALVGMKPGSTTLHVWSGGWSSHYTVTVLPVARMTRGGVAQ